MNEQREVVYSQRRRALGREDLKDFILTMISDKTIEMSEDYADRKISPEEWDLPGLSEAVFKYFNFHLELDEDRLEGLDVDGLADLMYEECVVRYEEKEKQIGAVEFRQLEQMLLLQTVDALWKDHLLSMDHLKEGIGLRGYAQQNPLIIYKREAFAMFSEMIDRIKEETLAILFRIRIETPEKVESLMQPEEQKFTLSHGDADDRKKAPVRRKEGKVGRNDPCPCGSGKKYKKCCGA